MTQLLLKLFIKGDQNIQNPHTRSAIGTLSGWVGIGCNGILFFIKLLLGFITGSVSVMADAMNNLSDASGSVVTLLAFRLTEKPADDHHPYGHARAEYVSALAVAAMIVFIGMELGKSSVDKILNPAVVVFSGLSGWLLILSIGVKLWLSLFYKTVGSKIDSSALLTASIDSRNDCISTAGVLLAALLERVWNIRSDGWFGLAIAVFILISGWKMARDTISTLLGESPDPQIRQQILDLIRSKEGVLGYHDLMIHDYGPGQRYASVHVEMDHRQDPLHCHGMIDEMEWECLKDLNVHLVIHYDPVIIDDPEVTRLQQRILMLLQEYDHRLSLHDFRMVQGKKHMNLIFHVPIPQDLRIQEKAIRNLVESRLKIEDGKVYHVTITYDPTAFNPEAWSE